MVTKKPTAPTPLSMIDIVMRADVATIRAALEAREKVDALLAERAAAYERIAALEKQIDDVVGGPDLFVFPAPPVPVAAYTAAPAVKRPAPVAATPAAAPAAPAAANTEAPNAEAAAESAAVAEESAGQGAAEHTSSNNRRSGNKSSQG